MDVGRRELGSVHPSDASLVAVGVGRLRRLSMTGKRKRADRRRSDPSPPRSIENPVSLLPRLSINVGYSCMQAWLSTTTGEGIITG